MWSLFLTWWNGHSFFLDTAVTSSPEIELFTDAASTAGFGGYFKGQWLQGGWPPNLLLNHERVLALSGKNYFPL